MGDSIAPQLARPMRDVGPFAALNEDTEWFMYGFSVLHCLPACLADRPSAATGTVMRDATLRQYAVEAGFRDVAVLPVDNYFYAFYRLVA